MPSGFSNTPDPVTAGERIQSRFHRLRRPRSSRPISRRPGPRRRAQRNEALSCAAAIRIHGVRIYCRQVDGARSADAFAHHQFAQPTRIRRAGRRLNSPSNRSPAGNNGLSRGGRGCAAKRLYADHQILAAGIRGPRNEQASIGRNVCVFAPLTSWPESATSPVTGKLAVPLPSLPSV